MTYEEARKIYLEGRLAWSPYDARLLAELGPAPPFYVVISGQLPEPAPDQRGPNVLNFGEWRSRKRPQP
jgi:hypothetical protein